MSQEFTQLQP